ncbi:GTPase-activating Rap/Ran-GAP domain-like protein 3, partial [Hyalella azteca]|uniref:GTPase-activating Rap/Ran-GAP domain-like protein 3 n=1 Tax=Hyalella azteca TaxID=294128 RepID=A0A979FWB5_HYAAZ
INGEKATLNTPIFSQKRERTLDMLIRDLYQEHINDNRGVERKRHIGNDIVNIVYLEGSPEDMASFSPSYIKSQFTHIFALVTYNSDEASYRLHVYSEETVPLFGPSLSGSCVFHNHDEFREFLLVKCKN